MDERAAVLKMDWCGSQCGTVMCVKRSVVSCADLSTLSTQPAAQNCCVCSFHIIILYLKSSWTVCQATFYSDWDDSQICWIYFTSQSGKKSLK